jgi:hypothetical protein
MESSPLGADEAALEELLRLPFFVSLVGQCFC